jgi:hypothetical protein
VLLFGRAGVSEGPPGDVGERHVKKNTPQSGVRSHVQRISDSSHGGRGAIIFALMISRPSAVRRSVDLGANRSQVGEREVTGVNLCHGLTYPARFGILFWTALLSL